MKGDPESLIIELKNPDMNYLNQMIEFFDDKNFFFKTKRPESLSEAKIKELVFESSDLTYLIFIDNRFEGIFSIEEDTIQPSSILFNLRFKNMRLAIDHIDTIFSYLCSFVDEKKMIKFRVYDFDEEGKEICKLLSFNLEAILRSHIFKFNKYHNLLIYSKNLSEVR